MAKPRVYTEPETEAGVYHVCSRVVDQRHIFGEPEKEEFVRMMRSLAAFHGVEILTFCVMRTIFTSCCGCRGGRRGLICRWKRYWSAGRLPWAMLGGRG